MTFLTDKVFWVRSAERAVKTFAQSLVTVIGADKVAGFFDASFTEAILAALFATFLSFLTSVASTRTGEKNSPSLFDEKIEDTVVDKIEEGEPVGDPPTVYEPVSEEVPDEGFNEPVGILEPVEEPKPKRKPRKKAV